MNCRICESKMTDLMKLKDIPLGTNIFYELPKKNSRVVKNITFFSCSNCGHYQIDNFNPEGYYDDYGFNETIDCDGSIRSEKMRNLIERELATLISYAKRTKTCLDVGAGYGRLLLPLSKLFDKAIGFEPSKKEAESLERQGLNVVKDYFPGGHKSNLNYDAFVSSQVFEHLPNPLEVLKAIYSAIDIDAVGLIEVPNGRKIIRDGRYYEIISDHLNYFTPKSLLYLVEKCGFEIIELKEEFGGDYLIAYVKKSPIFDLPDIAKQKDRKVINNLFKTHKNIVVWGAGAKAFNFMTILNEDDTNILAYMDISPIKCGNYLPNASQPVIEVNEKLILKAELLIVFASSYEGRNYYNA